MRWLRRFQPIEWLVALGILATLTVLLFPNELAAIFDQNPDNSRPIASVLPPGVPLGDQADIQIIETGRNTNSSTHHTIDFVLLNNGPTPVYYHGYTPASFAPRLPHGQLRPFYKKEIKVEADWTDQRVSRCGTGAATMCLQPGEAGNFFAVQHHDERIIRIGVSYSPDAQSEAEQALIAWSDPIEFE